MTNSARAHGGTVLLLVALTDAFVGVAVDSRGIVGAPVHVGMRLVV